DVLLTKVLETPGVRHFLESHPVLVIDHHATKSNLSFEHTLLTQPAISTSDVLYGLAPDAGWALNAAAAECMLDAQLSDSLGLSIQAGSPKSYHVAAALPELGAHVSVIDERRRALMKKSPEMLAHEGELRAQIEYYLD